MTAEYPLPVRYVLYTHYPEGNDFIKFSKGTPIPELPGVKFLVEHFKTLRGLLTWPGYEGLLVLFYAPGLAKCLIDIADQKAIEKIEETCPELEFARHVHDYLEGLMKEEHTALLPRLRLITAHDLHKIFGRTREIADFLKSWIVGDAEGMRYDSPKIVEAIVRLRLLGSGIPVFRVDYDVLLRGEENREKKNLEFSSTVGSCLTAYQLRRDSPNLSSFIFSASYDHQALLDPSAATDFHAWGRAYATRVFPALPVNQDLIKKTLGDIREREFRAERRGELNGERKAEFQADAWDGYAAKSFRPSLARRFFGFDKNSFKTSRVSGIGRIGAHPTASVISGAMLYLSDGAILDLPPFSNFSLNVSWIDDHLKYCLHRELRHLSPTRLKAAGERRPNPLLAYSKIDDVIVQKAGRKIQGDLRKYIFDVYLPTLLRGAIMDAWITPDPLLKYRPEELAKKERDALSKILREKQSGVLPAALQRALEAGAFIPAEKSILERRLKEIALRRISEVRRQWGALSEKGVETFASTWAKGQAQSCCPDIELDYPGIVANPDKVPIDADIKDEARLEGRLHTNFTTLIDDAQEYIDWTLNWPTVVQVVRSIEQGTLRTDLNYEVPAGKSAPH